MKYIALLGHGVVGTGVTEILEEEGARLAQAAGDALAIKSILTRLSREGDARFVSDFSVIERDADISIVVEVMGGLSPAYDYVRRALCAGKNVVTANKELIAEKGGELIALAKQNGVRLLFEASVGGGIPLLRPMRQNLAANRLLSLRGVLNGTTNYILSAMHAQGLSFSAALQRAQALGYAEADPTADVEGHDACRKLCILCSLAWGRHVSPSSVRCEGITHVTAYDVLLAEAGGFVIKLVVSAAMRETGTFETLVAPRLLPQSALLASLGGAYNALLCDMSNVGPLAFVGQGAGKRATASAVWSDILACCLPLPAFEVPAWSEAPADAPAPWESVRFRRFARCSYEQAARLASTHGWRLITAHGCPDAAVLTDPLSHEEAARLLHGCALLRIAEEADSWRKA